VIDQLLTNPDYPRLKGGGLEEEEDEEVVVLGFSPSKKVCVFKFLYVCDMYDYGGGSELRRILTPVPLCLFTFPPNPHHHHHQH
jgi:hypothetical protein